MKEDKERVHFSPSTRRRFTTDDELHVYAEINVPNAHSPPRANLSVQTVIRRVDEEVVSRTEKMKEGNDDSPKNFIHQGRYDLSELSPGNYSLEVQTREVDGSTQVDRTTMFEVIDSHFAASPVPPGPRKPSLYLQLLDTYRSGNLEDARRLLVAWTENGVSRAVKQLRSNTDDTKVFKAAVRNPQPSQEFTPLDLRFPRYRRAQLGHDQFLRQITDSTGGRFWRIDTVSNIKQEFLRVLEEIKSRYLLTYYPKAVDGQGWHRLEIKLKNHKGEVRARRGYYLPSSDR